MESELCPHVIVTCFVLNMTKTPNLENLTMYLASIVSYHFCILTPSV